MPTDTAATATASSAEKTLLVTHNGRAPVVLRRVWRTKDGRPPAAGSEPVASFQLTLGSADDGTEEIEEHNKTATAADKVPTPTQEVPEWVVTALRKVPLFANMEKAGTVRVHRSA